MRTFVIGDVHGHLDRLEALLAKAGISKDHPGVEIVQLGDLGNFGHTYNEGDAKCYQLAYDYDFVVLWGNHDRACFDFTHSFRGYETPPATTMEIVRAVNPQWAYSNHGYLFTHAGLHPMYTPVLPFVGAVELADYLNTRAGGRVRDGISARRGGGDPAGGILWRDAREDLFAGVPQIFGHTRTDSIRAYNDNTSFCIDVGDKDDPGNLCGMWLPDRELVAIGPDAQVLEGDLEEILDVA